MDSLGFSPLKLSPDIAMRLNNLQGYGSQPLTFQAPGLSPMQMSPPMGFFPPPPPLPRSQPLTFQAPAPTAPSFHTTTQPSFAMPTPKTVSGYNSDLNLGAYGVDTSKTGFVGNIEHLSKVNQNFRTVLYTTNNMQLVLMSLKAGQDIGLEVHPNNDQFFRIETGTGIVEIAGVRRPYEDGTAIQIPRGTQHNIIALTETKLYTIYSPPHHSPNKIDPQKP